LKPHRKLNPDGPKDQASFEIKTKLSQAFLKRHT